MINKFLQEYSKHEWLKWTYTSGELKTLKKANNPIPAEHGVYLFRAPHPIPRVLGESDIVYIGQSGGGQRGGRQGIGSGKNNPGRLFNTRGPDEWVREQIENL